MDINKKIAPTKSEAEIVETVIKLFSHNNITYEKALDLLPEIETALKRYQLNSWLKRNIIQIRIGCKRFFSYFPIRIIGTW